MACDKFESEGLLYCAGELDATAADQFEKHLTECGECSDELNAYKEMFGETGASSLLEEIPSAQCDAKILAALEVEAAAQMKPKVTMAGFMTMFIQKVAVPAAVFILALTIGLQFSNRGSDKAVTAEKSAAVKDSADSVSDSGRIFIQGGSQGVIPVTLQDTLQEKQR